MGNKIRDFPFIYRLPTIFFMAGKFFTLDEANALIPDIEETFDRIFRMNGELNAATMDLKDLFDIWGNEIMDNRNLDHFMYIERVKKRDSLMAAIKNEVAQMQALGIEIKDLKNGLVDFLYDNEGEIVLLCWRYGEKSVQYWHPVENGFASRRRIEELSGMKYIG